MKKAIIIIVSVLVVAGGAFAGLYFFTPVLNFLKPANDNFAMQAKKLLGTDEEADYSDYEKFLDKLKKSSGSQTANLDISMNMNLPTKLVDSSTQKLINSSKINLITSYDDSTKATSITTGITYNDSDLLTLDAITNGESVSIRSTDVYDKYITMDMSKYEEFCTKNNIDADEETLESIESLKNLNNIDSSTLLYDFYYISKDDYNALTTNYNHLEDLIDSKAYTSKKNQKITVNGDEVKTTAYSLTLTGKDSYEFLTNLFEKMQDDDTLKSLVLEKYDILKNYTNSLATTSSSSSSELEDLTESDIKDYFSDILDSLEDMEDDFEDIEKCLKLTIYSLKDEPVKFEVTVLDDEKDTEGTVIFTEELSDNKTVYTINLDKINKLSEDSSSSSSYSSSSSSYSKIIITDKYEKDDNSRKGTITISGKASGSSAQDLLTIDYDILNSDSEIKSNMTISIPSDISKTLTSYLSLMGISGLGSGDASISYTYHVTGLDTDTQNIELSMSGKLGSYSADFKATGTLSSEANVPTLTTENSVDLFSLSEEELVSTYKEIINSAADKLPGKFSKLGIKISKDDILSLIPESMNTTVEESIDTTTETTEEPAA